MFSGVVLWCAPEKVVYFFYSNICFNGDILQFHGLKRLGNLNSWCVMDVGCAQIDSGNRYATYFPVCLIEMHIKNFWHQCWYYAVKL